MRANVPALVVLPNGWRHGPIGVSPVELTRFYERLYDAFAGAIIVVEPNLGRKFFEELLPKIAPKSSKSDQCLLTMAIFAECRADQLLGGPRFQSMKTRCLNELRAMAQGFLVQVNNRTTDILEQAKELLGEFQVSSSVIA